jgi:hypothetical protein
MTKLITTTTRKTLASSFTAALMAAAIGTLMAGASTANAQQALSNRSTDGNSYRIERQFPTGTYARANSSVHVRGADVAAPQHDFQLEGR